MSASAAKPVARRQTPSGIFSGERSAPMLPLILGCLGLSALTLLFPSTPTYDPWAWIMWGREIVHLDLVTEGGPSWKPLPVLFTTPFSLLGASLAPMLWLWIARAGALLSMVMAFRLGRRLTGPGVPGWVGGIFAALFLLTTYQFVRDSMLGNSEAMLAALSLWAFERHLDGRRDHALYLGFAAALLRPEAWPFLGLYGLWLWFREPELRVRIAVIGVAVPVLWFGPELWGSGEPLRASSRANNPNPGSAAFADNPTFEVIKRFAQRTVIPLFAAAAVATALAARAWLRDRRDGATLALAGIGFSWISLVAVMTAAGYAGNQRYLVVTTAALCVLGGVGIGRIFAAVRSWADRVTGTAGRGLAATAVACLVGLVALSPVIKNKADNIDVTLDILRYEASLWDTLPGAIEKGGGRDRLLACGNVYSGPFQTQMVAYELGIHGIDVGALLGTPAPGVVFRTHTRTTSPLVPKLTDPRMRLVTISGRWRLVTAPRSDARGRACPAAGPDAPRVAPRAVTPELQSSR